jgi:hypothetical protein
MKRALVSVLFIASSVNAMALGARTACTVEADSSLGMNRGTEVGYECPIIIVTAKAGLKLELVDGKNGMCIVKFERTTEAGTKLGLKFDGEKQDPWIGDGCSVKVIDPATGESGYLEVAAVET